MLSTFALIGILVGLGISSLGDSSSGQTSVTGTPTDTGDSAPAVDYETPDVDDDDLLGDENAPVTMIIFSDYECPYCQRFETETMPQVIENFVDTGLVNVVFRDFPLSFHENAHLASEAAECAGDYDLYWEYHDLLAEGGTEWSDAEDVEVALVDYGTELGIDISTCLAEGTYYDEVDDDLADGRAAGVQGTPSVFINGEMHVGALPYEDYAGQDGSMNPGYESLLNEAVEAAS